MLSADTARAYITNIQFAIEEYHYGTLNEDDIRSIHGQINTYVSDLVMSVVDVGRCLLSVPDFSRGMSAKQALLLLVLLTDCQSILHHTEFAWGRIPPDTPIEFSEFEHVHVVILSLKKSFQRSPAIKIAKRLFNPHVYYLTNVMRWACGTPKFCGEADHSTIRGVS